MQNDILGQDLDRIVTEVKQSEEWEPEVAKKCFQNTGNNTFLQRLRAVDITALNLFL